MLEPIKWAEARTAREQIEREVGVAAQTPGTSFPAVLRVNLVIARYSATSFFDQLNSVRSIHMRCTMTKDRAEPIS
jgi:hypothetical protein